MSPQDKILRRAVLVSMRLGGGGLTGLRDAFARIHEGAVFDSWVACGPNLPTTASVIERALGEGLRTISAATGKDVSTLSNALADLLPRVVDELTPDGRLPAPRRSLLARWRSFLKGEA